MGASPVRLDVQAELDRTEPEVAGFRSEVAYAHRLAGKVQLVTATRAPCGVRGRIPSCSLHI